MRLGGGLPLPDARMRFRKKGKRRWPHSMWLHAHADNTAEREITDQQFVRLYVAERRPESGKPEATGPSDQYWDRYNVVLYCDKYYDLEGQTYHVENLPGVWHKFAFVCVPDISQGMGSGMFPAQNTFLTYKDLYDFAIDYRPVLDYQAALNEASKETWRFTVKSSTAGSIPTCRPTKEC